MSDEPRDIFSNKIAVSSIYIGKLGEIMALFRPIIRDWRRGKYSDHEIQAQERFSDALGSCQELHYMLEGKLDNFKGTDEYTQLNELVKKYEETKEDISIEELRKTVRLLFRFIVKLKFLDVEQKGDTIDDAPQYW